VIIESSAPTRVDLSGGTIDIWPLYLFHPGAATVNFAVNLRASCRIETNDDDRVVLESRDRKEAFETTLSAIEDLIQEERLELISKLVHFFKPTTGFHLTAESNAPAGAGLGGSSTLAIACIGALNRLVGNRYSPDKFIQIAANIETTVIKVPAGVQDYYSAQYGGLSCIHFGMDGIVREALTTDVATLERRLVICYTGEPRLSGINNWEMTKSHIDGNPEILTSFDRIRDTSIKMRSALLTGNWVEVGEVMREAYPNRKKLAPNITTPHMDRLVEKALKNGAVAAKVCGAGGGGCIAFYCEDARRRDVEHSLLGEEGVQVLDWALDPVGLTVTES
jgi:D-glycero-alpha-D-manno-heptose-7-phosphate kinase